MGVKNFSSFIQTYKINENSDLDWSDKNWDERGQDGENPPNNGLEGSSAFQADYYAGNYGETGEDQLYVDDESTKKSSFRELEAAINDLTVRVSNLESKKSTN
jgi:hypothetical protein